MWQKWKVLSKEPMSAARIQMTFEVTSEATTKAAMRRLT
jgi:hypothetical protein